MRRLILFASILAASLAVVPAASARVLLVGSYNGVRGQYKSIQAAVDAAKRGDWILVGPGRLQDDVRAAPRRETPNSPPAS